MFVVWAGQPRRSISVYGAHYVVVCEKVVEAQILHRSTKLANSARVAAKLRLRIDDSDLHELHPSTHSQPTNRHVSRKVVRVSSAPASDTRQ